ncbi:MAG: CDP-diacylglycerol--serine O-phosphatidyltransferase [Vicinamibacterales bacterium]
MIEPEIGVGRRSRQDPRHYRRGIYLLPSIITVGNMFCGYACVVYASRGELVSAAPFIGFAVVLDMLDGRIARMTNTASAFGLEFDSLADVISFGLAPAVLAFAWGLSELDRTGWAAGFVYVTAAATRLARFNIQTPVQTDKRYFVGMPSPAAAGVIAATVYAWPVVEYPNTMAALVVVLVPAALMVSTIKFRSFKTINFGWTPSYIKLLLIAAMIALVALQPRVTLVIVSYGYLLSAFIEMGMTRLRSHRDGHPPAAT